MKWRDFGVGIGVGLVLLILVAAGLVAVQPREITITQTTMQTQTVTEKVMETKMSEITMKESVTVTKSELKTVTKPEIKTITITSTTTVTSIASATPTTTTSSTTTTTASPTTTTTPAISEYTLNEAIENRYVEAKITGRCHSLYGCGGLLGGGVSSGDSITLELRRLVDYTIRIVVVRGTLLLASGDAQNMVVRGVRGITRDSIFFTPVSEIILDSSETRRYLLSAYCVDFHKPNPTNATIFSLSGLASPEIIRVLEVIDQLPSNVTSVRAIQVAIFVITDDVSREELDKRFPVKSVDIENAKIILEAAGIDTSTKKLFR